jgi:hypothetical protein
MALKRSHVIAGTVLALLALASLVRGGETGARPEAAQPPLERSVAAAAARARADLPINPRILKVGANQVQVIDIPSMVSPKSALVETRRCYVWRDLEFRTASVTCPEDGEMLPAAGPPPSGER